MSSIQQPTAGNRQPTALSRSGRVRRLLLAAAAVTCLGGAVAWRMIPPYVADLEEYGQGTQVLDRSGNVLRESLGRADQACRPIPVSETGDWVVPALVAAEDKRFYQHRGIDIIAVMRATRQNLANFRRVSGASTISTLVVKMTQPRARNVWTKIVEAHHALSLERDLSKPEILEQFLNRAPFGSNIQGIESASRRYFGRASKDLTLAEAALLVGLPQSPSRLRPDRHYLRALRRRHYVLERMLARGAISEQQAREAERQPPVLSRSSSPFRAPHFCDYMLQQHPGEKRLLTTLDLHAQELAEDVLRRHIRDLAPHGVHGGAVVIQDVSTGAVRAMVGSPGFADRRHAGQVNGALSRRSPGSALKPFIYALAIDQGMCTPASIVADTPMHFKGYDPKNFNLRYLGPVSVRDALVHSLNIPALRLAERVGAGNAVALLKTLGLTTLDKPATHYGLSIAVGTCEVRLLDLVNAYACLARGGVHRSVRLIETGPPPVADRLLSEEAAYLVADILSGDERALQATGHLADAVLPRVAWKTGTSTGHRDAWTLAYNPEYVVGVWVGNADGHPSPVLVGSRAAAPIAHEIFRRLYPDGNAPWYRRPPGLRRRPVCARSGCPPGAHCAVTEPTDYIPGITQCDTCDVHRPCPVTGTVRECWPPELEAFLTAHGMAEAMPRGDPAPQSVGSGPRIVSPVNGEELALLPRGPHPQQLPLRAEASSPSTRMYWFVDGVRLAAAAADRTVYWPLAKGTHTIACCDASGRSDTARITVSAL